MFFFNDTATTEIYTLSLHNALPIWPPAVHHRHLHSGLEEGGRGGAHAAREAGPVLRQDRKSTRLNSSHANISYAVFCLKKNILLYYYLRISNMLPSCLSAQQIDEAL